MAALFGLRSRLKLPVSFVESQTPRALPPPMRVHSSTILKALSDTQNKAVEDNSVTRSALHFDVAGLASLSRQRCADCHPLVTRPLRGPATSGSKQFATPKTCVFAATHV